MGENFGGGEEDIGLSLQKTSDGGYVIAGGTYSFGAGNQDVYLIKTNAFGDTLWTKTFGGSNNDIGTSIHQTNDGGYIIVGSTASFGAEYSDVYLIKTNANGDTLLQKLWRAPLMMLALQFSKQTMAVISLRVLLLLSASVIMISTCLKLIQVGIYCLPIHSVEL